MPRIDKLSWGKVKVDGQDYHQVLLVGGKTTPRDVNKLKKLFKTTHQIGDWERKKLLENKPEMIIIASGWDGALKVDENFKQTCQKAGVELRVLLSQKAVAEYNRLVAEGRNINALIHTTC
jgi:hypothetical protein